MPVELEFAEQPVVERIALTLEARVAAVRRENGFWVDVATVVRPAREGGGSPVHGGVEMMQQDPEDNPELSLPGNPPRIAYDQPFTLSVYILQSEKDPTPLDQVINLYRSEIERGITCGDPSTPDLWRTFNGLAITSKFRKPAYFSPKDGGFAGITLTLVVSYRTPENDPYTVG